MWGPGGHSKIKSSNSTYLLHLSTVMLFPPPTTPATVHLCKCIKGTKEIKIACDETGHVGKTLRFNTIKKEFQWIHEEFYSHVNSFSTALLSRHGLIMPAPVLISFLSSVKAASKKAEKNKKSAVTTPNSISEGGGQYSPVTEGKCATKFSISGHLLSSMMLSNVK